MLRHQLFIVIVVKTLNDIGKSKYLLSQFIILGNENIQETTISHFCLSNLPLETPLGIPQDRCGFVGGQGEISKALQPTGKTIR